MNRIVLKVGILFALSGVNVNAMYDNYSATASTAVKCIACGAAIGAWAGLGTWAGLKLWEITSNAQISPEPIAEPDRRQGSPMRERLHPSLSPADRAEFESFALALQPQQEQRRVR